MSFDKIQECERELNSEEVESTGDVLALNQALKTGTLIFYKDEADELTHFASEREID